MKQIFKAIVLGLTVLLGGCAVGQKYTYHTPTVPLPEISGENKKNSIIIGATDSRSYVLSGDKTDKFVGLLRGGFGNPFDVTTTSGEPFVEDVLTVVKNSFTEKGFQIIAAKRYSDKESFVQEVGESGADKAIYLNIVEWKTDAYASISLKFDLQLEVFDSDGKSLAKTAQTGLENIGGVGIQTSNIPSATNALSRKLSYLFFDDQIAKTLN